MLRALPLHPQPQGHTVDLHVNEAGSQDAASAVPLLVGHAPLFKEQLLRVQNSALAHPQVLAADRAGQGLGPPASRPPHPRLHPTRAAPRT